MMDYICMYSVWPQIILGLSYDHSRAMTRSALNKLGRG